jgi:hypothetical protein
VDGELDGVVLLQRDAAEELAAEAKPEPKALGVGLGTDELGGREGEAEARDPRVQSTRYVIDFLLILHHY